MAGKTILVIDDTPRILNIIQYFLEAEGYSVKTAGDPLLGLKMVGELGPDLIILDIMMPKMNGYQVFEKLRENEKTQQIPVIMLTAQAVIENTPRAFFFGLYGVLAKPFTRSQLVARVKNILSLTEGRDASPVPEPAAT
ncbi:MAG: response regulator [Planctomycetes bacterium]|nr:response regulator [Planctomycetota bacterium]